MLEYLGLEYDQLESELDGVRSFADDIDTESRVGQFCRGDVLRSGYFGRDGIEPGPSPFDSTRVRRSDEL
jgi:hypothetical protein